MSEESSTTETATGTSERPTTRRRVVAWDPSGDTLVALATLLLFWGCYWAGTNIDGWFLTIGVIVVGTIIPAWTVLHHRREGLEGLGFRRRFLILSLVISALAGIGSAYQLIAEADAAQVEMLPHLLGNLLVFWEPFFVFGWLFLRWERAFGWLPAIVLTGVGFALQHVGSVPIEAAAFFGIMAVAFSIPFVFVRNLAILWPLFYPVASGIGTLQAGFAMGWDEVVTGAGLLAVQAVVLVAMAMAARRGGSARPAHTGAGG